MLGSLSIRGFRGLRELEIPALGRANLIVGRNAVGKTSVLEAVQALTSESEWFESIESLLIERQEFASQPVEDRAARDWRRLFHADNGAGPTMQFNIKTLRADGPSLVVERRWGRRVPEEVNEQLRSRWEFSGGEGPGDAEDEELLVSGGSGGRQVVPVRWMAGRQPPRIGGTRREQHPNTVFLRAAGHSPADAARLWEGIALTDSEDDVLDALRLIDCTVEKVVFVERGRSTHGRVPLVKRKGRTPEPLRALGEGAVRLLEIAVSMANARGGTLLIDEFENGIHYSVQPEIWRLVFKVAARLEVQVFAATHSWDCIDAFQTAACEHPEAGVLVRLERDAEGVFARTFTEDELAVVTRQTIEVR